MSKKEKPILTPEQVYKKNKKKSKTYKVLSPIFWYTFLCVFLLFIGLTFKNSVGNVLEILELLDTEKYSGAEVKTHYQMLVEQWGEWTIVGEENSSLVVKYVNVSNAMFSGLMVTYCILSAISLLCAVLFGKIVFPMLAKHYETTNTELVNLTSLQSAAQIAELTKQKGEWF